MTIFLNPNPSPKIGWYWILGIGAVVQALVIIGLARLEHPGVVWPQLFDSLPTFVVACITTSLIVWKGVMPLIEVGEKAEGAILLCIGVVVWYATSWIAPGGWMVIVIFRTLALWSVVTGALILFRVARDVFYDLSGW